MKQVPSVFVLMSGKKTKDYRKVMRTILDLLPQKPKVNQVMVDFEKAMQNCLHEVLPDVMVKGCVFHWTQALWRKIKELGLQPAYQSDDGTFKYLHKIIALPFLPASQIPAMFTRLQLQANTEPLQKFGVCSWHLGAKHYLAPLLLECVQAADSHQQ